ncbi:MAG: threonine ammonia-lyase [Rhizobiaceae bacterium]
MSHLPTAANVADAARAIAGVARRTPLLTSPELDAITGARVFLKPEMLQHTGSFKFRGAYNRLSRIPAEDRQKGVVAVSSGNHAQGVALAGQMLGIPVTCLMPADSPAAKIERTRRSGAELVLFDRDNDDRYAMARDTTTRLGAVFVPPFDDFFIMAGQGTVGREIVEDLKATGVSVDAVLIPCGGGGLTAGCALAIHGLAPSAAVWTVEPEGFDDQARSFAAGERLSNARTSGSICDGLLSPEPGELTFAVNRHQVAGSLVVSDEEVRRAVAFAFHELKLVVEPSGAVALAALLSGRIDVRDQTVAIVLTGGNVDAGLFAEMVG